MPSICVISDTHKSHRQIAIPEVDILIHCADFCSFGQEDEETLDDVDRWFAESRYEKILCVPGNHDYALEGTGFQFAHAEILIDRLIEVDGISVYGSPWCPNLPGFAFHADDENLIERWRAIPTGLDVLVTHTPPHGILDLPSSGNVNLRCKHLSAELARISPRLHLFGHVHASHGRFLSEKTLYVNASIVGGSDFAVRNPPTIITLPTTPEHGSAPGL